MKTYRLALVALFSAFASAHAGMPSELVEGDRVSLADLDRSEASWLVSYPGLNGDRACLYLAADRAGPFDFGLFLANLRAYDGARFLFGGLEYGVTELKPSFDSGAGVVIPLASRDAYQTGVALRTTEVGESISELVRRASRGGVANLVLRIGRCGSP